MVKLPVTISLSHRGEEASLQICQTQRALRFDVRLIYNDVEEAAASVLPEQLAHEVNRLSDLFYDFVEQAWIFSNPDELQELPEEELAVEDLPPLDDALALLSKMGYQEP
jgi:hypothetical protein